MAVDPIAIDPAELETMIRRVVRQELAAFFGSPSRSILDDWRQEGPDDPAGDALLEREALAALEADRDRPEAWLSWEESEAELDRAEAAGELPP